MAPHLDDAVLAASDLLGGHPRAVALTVFAGSRPTWSPVTAWDRACGFADGDDVIAARRDEDRAGLRLLGAEPDWLDFPEAAYRTELDAQAVESAVASWLGRHRPEQVALPVGLHHEDHRITHDTALAAARRCGYRRVLLYADFYHLAHPRELEARLGELAPRLTPVGTDAHPAVPQRRKRKALGAYRSQIRGLGKRMPRWASADPERYWWWDAATGDDGA